MPSYKVLKTGFWGGILRVPGGRHDPVVTADPIPKGKMPSWLQLIEETPEPRKPGRGKKINETEADFMGDAKEDADGGLETL